MDDSSKLMVSVPPRSSFDTLFTGGFSPGPMTLVSSFFSDPDNCSFSQLLAGAMASPIGTPTNSFGSTSTITYSGEDASETVKDSGYKQNRPMGLLVAPSPLFMIPPGLTPSGLLNSPGFLSPLQSPFGMSHQQALAHVTAQAAYTQSYMQIQTQPSELALKTESNSPEIPISSPEKKPATYSPVEKMENDGYNWRKYGQKQVKASEHPRSYYRCTNMNCPVKKKVERSVNGNITEITYKGQHNHDPPVLNKRSKDSGPQIKSTGDELALIEVPEHSEMLESAIIVKDEDENEQPNAKRRCSEANSSSHKTVTESRIVVQTRSEVDLLDDGFKWRKYGQKVVKGNPYPRSYYRCTYTGCNVRKHVERSSTDPKAVITTYEGKHDHDLPTAKNSCGNTNKKLNTKRAIKSGIEFQHKDQVPALLQLKEGEITV